MKEAYLLTYLLLCLGLGSAKAQFNIPEKDKCKVKASATASQDSVCQGYSDTLNASVSGGAIPYTYSWIPDTGLSCNTCPNPIATPNNTTTYTVTVTDNNGCSATAKVKVKVNKPPVFNANANLALLLAGDSLHATGGDPPYTYNWAPPISSSLLLSLPTHNTNYTLTVTGANGCSNTDIATYIPAPNKTGTCGSIFIDQYIQDTLNHNDAIELYNPTPSNISLDDYYLFGTTNGSLYAPPFIIRLHGTIKAYKTFLVANTHADSALTHKAKMLSDSLNFGGSDIVALATMTVVASHVAVQALDAVGAVSPLPTDSGWAVSTGSTKNHTLIRQAIVTQGDISWPSCQLQWTVFPQGTFSKIGNYNNVCTPKDAQIYYELPGEGIESCNPTYLYFPILAVSDSLVRFNSCKMYLNIRAEFSGDSVSNGGVTVTQGALFQPGPGNDYNILSITNVSDTVIEIQFGDPSDSSPNGTMLPVASPSTVLDTLLQVKLKVQSCLTSTVVFTDFGESYYTISDSVPYLAPDTTSYTVVCVGCIHDSCDYDSTCSCYLSECAYDSVNYTIGTITLYHQTNPDIAYSNTDYYGNVFYPADIRCGIQIDSLTNPVFGNNTIAVGTNAKSVPANSSILTIWGDNFGNVKDSIWVWNANASNHCRLDSSDILSWSFNKIVVKMPSSILNNPAAMPGTGPMRVFNTCGESAAAELQINYSILNAHIGAEKLRPNIVMINPSESFNFRCDTSISNNPKALACVKKALREWNCYTGINWKLGADTIGDTTYKQDGISVIYFTNIDTNSGILMQTHSWYDSCSHLNLTDSVTFKDEADIEIRRNFPYGSYWDYDTTGAIDTGNIAYFYDAILHELGHAHGLGHINDQLSLMYWFTPPGPLFRPDITSGSRYPGPGTLEGALDMINTSIAAAPSAFGCVAYSILRTDSTECKDPTLSVPVISENPYNLNLYPNPDDGETITISYKLTTNSNIQFKITDCTGRVIIQLSEENKHAGDYKEQISVNGLAQGLYLFLANINGEVQTIKFIKL